MRARFAAYVSQAVLFLVNTTHPENDHIDGAEGSTLEQDIAATCNKCRFLRLEIVERKGGSTEDEAYIRFNAYYRVVGQLDQDDDDQPVQLLTELSRFKRLDGRWLYHNAVEADAKVL